jgi:predicted signal transduction protein with EAL and GGDEF domain
LAVFPDEARDVNALIDLADQRLYVAKERGRNRVEVASLDMTGDRRKFEATSTSSVAAIGTKSAA